jgi:hypothetical protein
MMSTVHPVDRPHKGIWNSRSYERPRILKGSRHCSRLDTDAATASASKQPNGYIKVREESQEGGQRTKASGLDWDVRCKLLQSRK